MPNFYFMFLQKSLGLSLARLTLSFSETTCESFLIGCSRLDFTKMAVSRISSFLNTATIHLVFTLIGLKVPKMILFFPNAPGTGLS